MNEQQEAEYSQLQQRATDIDKQINTLFKEREMLYARMKKLNVDHNPKCTRCGRHSFKKDMWIATQEDLDDYTSQNSGYGGPTIGEWYCGC